MRLLEWIDRRLPLTELVERHLTRNLEPPNLNSWWNFGSLAGLFLLVQIASGVFLAMYYKPETALAFDSVQHIIRHVNYGWLLRYLHALGASGFFFAVYLHIGRAFYYGSYKPPRELVWLIGFAIYLSLMAEAFMGYLLPWGQMSFWSATVITSIFGTIPVIGPDLVIWLRGDFAVGDPTLGRFFALHVAVLPIALIGGLVILHITALHRVGSGNPEGVDLDEADPRRIPFWPYYVTRDLWFDALLFMLFAYLVFFRPTLLLEPTNWEPANPLLTPEHLVPEWYFVPFYAILRSIPSKFGGALAMAAAIFLPPLLPWLDRSPVRSARYRPVKRLLTWLFFLNFVALGYLGSQLPLGPVLILERLATAAYFLYFALLPLLPRFERIRPLPTLLAVFAVGLTFAHPVEAGEPRPRITVEEASIVRGKALFAEVCRSCHGLHYLGELAPLTEDAARAAFGKIPPDLSLMALARGREREGAVYIAALLEGYTDTSLKNGVYPGIAMPAPFAANDPDLRRKAADVAAYLLSVADPHAEERRRLGRPVLAYLGLLTALLYLVNRRVRRAAGPRWETRGGAGVARLNP